MAAVCSAYIFFLCLVLRFSDGNSQSRQTRLLIQDDLLHTVQTLATKVENQTKAIEALAAKVTQLQAENIQLKKDINDSRKSDLNSIAITAFLDHDLDGLGNGQTIVFDKTTLNEGNNYNTNTGIFTCTKAGIYLFSLFVGERNAGQGVWAHLVVDNKSVVDAVVDSFHDTQDLQGGNVALLRLKSGQSVWVKSGDLHVEGSSTRKICTFSGVLLHN